MYPPNCPSIFANIVLYRDNVIFDLIPDIPDFKLAFQHFCIHAGGRAVIDGMETNLKLRPYDVEPSRATLYRYPFH